MSLYAKAWWFMAWTILVFLTSGLWFFEPIAKWGIAAGLPGMAFWLAHGAASVWLFVCPRCRCSAFATGKGWAATYTPWPHQKCYNCGLELTSTNVR
jgi:hypothetical protein